MNAILRRYMEVTQSHPRRNFEEHNRISVSLAQRLELCLNYPLSPAGGGGVKRRGWILSLSL